MFSVSDWVILLSMVLHILTVTFTGVCYILNWTILHRWGSAKKVCILEFDNISMHTEDNDKFKYDAGSHIYSRRSLRFLMQSNIELGIPHVSADKVWGILPLNWEIHKGDIISSNRSSLRFSALQQLHSNDYNVTIVMQQLHCNYWTATIALQEFHYNNCTAAIGLKQLDCNVTIVKQQF